MSNNCAPPKAELMNDAVATGRITHSIFAAASAFFTLSIIFIFTSIKFTGEIALIFNPRTVIICTIISALAGLSLLPFRTLAWYWAIVSGIAVSIFLGFVGATLSSLSH
jgi:hypothetical protein